MRPHILNEFASKPDGITASLSIKILVLTAIAYFVVIMWSDFLTLSMNRWYPVNDVTPLTSRFFFLLLVTILVLLLGYLLLYLFKLGRRVEKAVSSPERRENDSDIITEEKEND